MAKQPRKPAVDLVPPPAPDGATQITPPAPTGAPDAAAAMAAQVTGADQAPPPGAGASPQVAAGDQVADPAQKADNGPTPPETGTEGMAKAGEGAVAAASVPASLPVVSAAHAASYLVVSAVLLDNEHYAAGKHIVLDDEQFAQLSALGAVAHHPLPDAAAGD